MKKYGEYFVEEDGTWLARWYEGNKVKDSQNGKAQTLESASRQAETWLATKKDK